MAVRTRDILGVLSLAVWLAMVALAVLALVAIPDWLLPDPSHGTAPPPPDGCFREINAVISTSRYVCRGTPADVLIGGTLNYARAWVGSILWLPLLVLAPPLWSLFPFIWMTLVQSALSFGLAAAFVRRFLLRARAARLASRKAPSTEGQPSRNQTST